MEMISIDETNEPAVAYKSALNAPLFDVEKVTEQQIKPSIYIKCYKGFGNKVFDLITGMYLYNKYSNTVDIHFAVDKSIYDTEEDPFFGKVFPQSLNFFKFMFMNQYRRLEDSIKETVIESLEDLPEIITKNIRFIGMYKFIYQMYSSLTDKTVFQINPKLISKKIEELSKTEYGCVHIRYGDKLCFADERNVSDKWSHYQYPVYTPDYFILQIRNLLEAEIDVIVMTDSMDIVQKYIMPEFIDNPHVQLVDSQYVESFYLLTKAGYLVLSYSTFSFAAAYLNGKAVTHLVKKIPNDPLKDYIYEDDAISPNWIIINVKGFILNYNQELIRDMLGDSSMCTKYLTVS